MTKHKHHDVIVAWAADTSKVVQTLSEDGKEWIDTLGPQWNKHQQYRIKPEAKPDVVIKTLVGHYPDGHFCHFVSSTADPNLRLTFSGEDGKLTKAEVL